MSSEGQTEQIGFSSCHPRFGRSKLILVHVVRGSDRRNEFLFLINSVGFGRKLNASCLVRFFSRSRFNFAAVLADFKIDFHLIFFYATIE